MTTTLLAVLVVFVGIAIGLAIGMIVFPPKATWLKTPDQKTIFDRRNKP